VLTVRNADGTPFLNSSRHEEFMRVLEKEALRRNFWFDIKMYTNRDDEFMVVEKDSPRPVPLQALKESEYIGHIVLKMLNRYDHLNAVFHRFIADTLGASGRPVAVIDDSEPAPPSADRHVRTFSLAFNPACGRAVAQYLLRLGHRKILYFSLYHKNEWSRNRYSGLDETFSSAGFPDSIIAVTDDRHVNEFYLAADTAIVWPGEMDALNETARRYFDRPEPLAALARRLEAQMERQKIAGKEWLFMQPMLERALEFREATAWVCANDGHAIEALDFLQAKGVKVPRDISVIGFDDMVTAYQHNLTSYNFNIAEAAHAMINYVLNPRAFAGLWDRPVVEIDGAVIERGTTGRPRKVRQQVSPFPAGSLPTNT
jgi:DNA-binding LacI/PurR family transcriptional regulator